MKTRKANFVLFRGESIQKVERYQGTSVVAVCLLNDVFDAFNVYTTQPLFGFFGKTKFILNVKLPNEKTGHKCGISEFDTLDAACTYGIDFIKKWFPELEAITSCKEEHF